MEVMAVARVAGRRARRRLRRLEDGAAGEFLTAAVRFWLEELGCSAHSRWNFGAAGVHGDGGDGRTNRCGTRARGGRLSF